MRTNIIAFAVGILILQWQPTLPTAWPLVLISGTGLAIVAGYLRRARMAARFLALVGCVLLGFAFSAWRAEWRLADQLANDWEGRDVAVVGVIAELPHSFERGSRFVFSVEQVLTADALIPRNILLSWYSESNSERGRVLRPGERWQFTVRLKRPHGNANPHGFDYEAWLLERTIRATGYVRPDGKNERLAEMVWKPSYLVERVRDAVRDSFRHLLPEEKYPYAGVLVALVIGDQRAIDGDLWNLFNRTGVTHLMSISGSHITMIAALAAALLAFGWRRVPALALRCPTRRAAIVAGLLVATLYTVLAGFAVPAQRTLFMLGVAALSLYSGRQPAVSRVLCLALFLVLLIDPWAVLAAGFWLSFGVVAALLFAGSAVLGDPAANWRSRMRTWGAAQWTATVASLPVLLLIFQQFSLVSPLANAIAIPVIGLMVTPLALLAAVVPWWPLLELAHAILALLMRFLQWCAQMPVWQAPAPPGWLVAVAVVGVFLVLLPRGMTGRWVGFALIVPVVFWSAPRPPDNQVWVDVLDVGQGLAVLVRTRHHTLLYDTGPRFSAESDAGQRVLVPYLRALGVNRLDTLVITHRDSDHSGGAESVRSALPVYRLLTSFAEPGAEFCLAGQFWEWDGVRFSVLHPTAAIYQLSEKSRNLSCLIRVEAGGRALLLIADTEARHESSLLQTHASALAADVMLVPHHGSRTSSSPAFLAAVGARHAVASSGYRNRFGHPKAEVVARYEQGGSQFWRTDLQGAVLVRMGGDGVSVNVWRSTKARYWYGQ